MVKDEELHHSVTQFSGRGMDILCVPFGSANSEIRATSRVGSASPSGAPEFTPDLLWVRVVQSSVFV
jgi:hypothetical protein